KSNDVQLQSAIADAQVAHEDRFQARTALLPNVSNSTQYLGTQGNGNVPTGRFVSNDGVHMYREWGIVHQEVTANTFFKTGIRRATAAEALANAKLEIAQRGLTVTVTRNYYALLTAQRHYVTAQQAVQNAMRFLQISQQQEQAGQVAHSDVVKAQIQSEQQDQLFQEAMLAMVNARFGPLPDQGYFITANLTIPIFDRATLRSKVRQNQAREQQARVQLSQTQRQVLSNLYAYSNEAAVARDAVDRLRRAADLSAESLRLITLRYQAGESTSLEVVDAQNTFTQARNAYDDAQNRYRVAIATLQTLSGNF